MLNEQHKRINSPYTNNEPRDGEPIFLCCNKGGMGSPSLDLSPEPPLENMELLVQFFELLIKVDKRINGNKYRDNCESNTYSESIN
jgi:hypothetical protein